MCQNPCPSAKSMKQANSRYCLLYRYNGHVSFWWEMLPFRLMLSLAYRKVFPTSKFQTSLKGKVADRKAGHITCRRQLQRTAGKRKIQNSQVLATLRETKWKGCEGKEGQEESIGQKKVPVISSAQERSLSSASVSDLFMHLSSVRLLDKRVCCWHFPLSTAN